LQSIASDVSISSNPSYGWKGFSSLIPDEKLGARKDVLRSGTIERTLQRIMSSSRKQMLDAEPRMYFHR